MGEKMKSNKTLLVAAALGGFAALNLAAGDLKVIANSSVGASVPHSFSIEGALVPARCNPVARTGFVVGKAKWALRNLWQLRRPRRKS